MHNNNTRNNIGSINGWLHWKVMKFGCRKPSLGLVTKVKACKDAGQEWNPGVTFHALGSLGKCEGMNPHTAKWTPTLGVGVLMDL
jgi:hypothetical protein